MVGVFKASQITKKAKGAKTLPEYGTRHCGVGGAMPICVFTQKADVCVGTQSCWFVQQHKMQMSNALSEAPQIQESVIRQQVAATEGG